MTAMSKSSSILARLTARMPWIPRIFDHLPPGQFGRYLLVGTWNTLFGYCSYAAFVALLDPRVRYGYIAAAALSSLVSITVSFLGYKWFVFKTKGNYLREWIRCFAVYSTGIVVGLIILPIVVQALRHGAGLGRSAPYIGGALLTCFGVLYNFMGHKKFSFRSS
jgi:putative flippase GtrA